MTGKSPREPEENRKLFERNPPLSKRAMSTSGQEHLRKLATKMRSRIRQCYARAIPITLDRRRRRLAALQCTVEAGLVNQERSRVYITRGKVKETSLYTPGCPTRYGILSPGLCTPSNHNCRMRNQLSKATLNGCGGVLVKGLLHFSKRRPLIQ